MPLLPRGLINWVTRGIIVRQADTIWQVVLCMLASKTLWRRLLRVMTVAIIILTAHCMSSVDIVWISDIALRLGGLRRSRAIVVVVLRVGISG